MWSNGSTTEDLNGLSPGIYGVTVWDALGCADSAEIQVFIFCPQPTGLTINAGTTTATFNWNPEPLADATQIQIRIPPSLGGGGLNTSIVTPPTTTKVVPTLIGQQYQSRTRHRCGNPNFSAWKFKPFITSARMSGGNEAVYLYPNPVDEVLTVAFNGFFVGENVSLEVTDVAGKELMNFTHQINAQNESISVNEVKDFSQGVYMLTVRSTSNVMTFKFVKN
jgi:hypothetical protein